MQKKSMLSECIACDPGKYCSGTAKSAITGTCTAGNFCTLGSTTPTPASATAIGGPCTVGFYCPAGATVKLPCPPKKYCATTLLSDPTGLCDAGYYCVGSATNRAPTNLASQGGAICPAGYYCVEGTSSPNPCPPGTFRSAVEGTQPSSCLTCTGGKYCQAFGGTAITGDCEAGYFCPAGSTVAKQNICPLGHRCPASSPSAIACTDPGYQDQKGKFFFTHKLIMI